MSNTTSTNIDISHLSPGAIADLKELYSADADTLPAIVEMGGEIGRLAALCQAVGCGATS